MDNILKLRDVRFKYNSRIVLDIPEMHITRRSINGLAGPNGSGKTTLFKLLISAEKCTSGTISYYDEEGKPAKNDRHKVVLLPQEPYLLKRSVFDNIVYGLKIRGIKDNLSGAVASSLDLVGLHHSFAKKQWYELSGGEAQRVALAARLVLKPDLLLLDEPTASVDRESSRIIRKAILLAQKEWGTTLIIASHNRPWLHDICDRIIYLFKGRILDFTYENSISGPWERVDDCLFRTRLDERQFFYVTGQPQPDSSAVINPESLEFSRRDPSAAEKALNGVVTGIYLDKTKTGFNVRVACGSNRFIVKVNDNVFAGEDFRPGKNVTLLYRPEQVVWLNQ